VRLEEASLLKGKTTVDIPITAITGVEAVRRRPVLWLLLAAVVFVCWLVLLLILKDGAPGALIGFITAMFVIFEAGLVGQYYYDKGFAFAVHTGGFWPQASLSVKESLIGGEAVDFAQFEQASALLNRLVLDKQKQNAALQAVLIRDALSKALAN
jgi:hypothetical protein